MTKIFEAWLIWLVPAEGHSPAGWGCWTSRAGCRSAGRRWARPEVARSQPRHLRGSGCYPSAGPPEAGARSWTCMMTSRPSRRWWSLGAGHGSRRCPAASGVGGGRCRWGRRGLGLHREVRQVLVLRGSGSGSSWKSHWNQSHLKLVLKYLSTWSETSNFAKQCRHRFCSMQFFGHKVKINKTRVTKATRTNICSFEVSVNQQRWCECTLCSKISPRLGDELPNI